MDKTARELYLLVEKHDGITFGSLCAISRTSAARIGTLLKYLTDEGRLFRSGSVGQYGYHTSRTKAEGAATRPRDSYTLPKEDIIASCKATSRVYRFDQLLRGAADTLGS